MDLSRQLEAEQRRLQERSQIAHLQGQLDELRDRLEQLSARAQLASEQARQTQDMFGQLDARTEIQAGEARLQEQTRQRAHQAVQREVAELRARIDEPARQLLTAMAQIQDVQEHLRLLREQAEQSQDGAKQLGKRIEEIRAQGLLWEEHLARLDSLVGRLLEGEESREQAIRQMQTDLQAERQNLRRQAGDVDRLAADLRGETQELLARLNRLAELQRQGTAAMEALGERIDAMGQETDRLMAELKRVEREMVEHDLEGQERLEALRQGTQREWSEIRHAEERRAESQNAWLHRIEELYHGMDERLLQRDEELSTTLGRLDARLGTVERQGEELMRNLLDIFRQQLGLGIDPDLGQPGPSRGA